MKKNQDSQSCVILTLLGSYSVYEVAVAAVKAIPIGLVITTVHNNSYLDLHKKQIWKEICHNCINVFASEASISIIERGLRCCIINTDTEDHVNSDNQLSLTRSELSKICFRQSLITGSIYHVSVFLFREGILIYQWLYRLYLRHNHIASISNDDERSFYNENKSKETNLYFHDFLRNSVHHAIVCVSMFLLEGFGAFLSAIFSPDPLYLSSDHSFIRDVYYFYSFVY